MRNEWALSGSSSRHYIWRFVHTKSTSKCGHTDYQLSLIHSSSSTKAHIRVCSNRKSKSVCVRVWKMEGVDHLAHERKRTEFDVDAMKIVWAGSSHVLQVSERMARLVASDPVNLTQFLFRLFTFEFVSASLFLLLLHFLLICFFIYLFINYVSCGIIGFRLPTVAYTMF